MNIKWLLVPALMLTLQASGQATLAKLKYEEAEEAFAANDFGTTIKKLDETEKLLGSSNPKILYLRIVAQAGQLKAEPYLNLEQVARLRKNYTEYLTKNDGIEGIEDKYKEVYKISEAFKTVMLPEQAFANAAKGNVADMEAIAMANEDYGNWPGAHEWYNKAAAKNSALAYSRLAYMHMDGYGVTADAAKAREYIDKAVAAAHPAAYYTLYMWHYSGREGYVKDSVKAEEYLYKSYEAALPAAQKGNAHMLFYAGRALIEGNSADKEKGWPMLEKAAEKGDYDAAELMAIITEEGRHGLKDNAKALAYYQLAAEKGSSGAEYRIGELYYKGVDGTPDYAKAEEWFERAANHGQPAGTYMLGDLYFNGRGVTADVPRALKYLDQSARKGYPYAWVSIGQIFYNGAGNLAKDYVKAAQYLQLAAEAGEPEGIMQLGHLYAQGGNGLTQDYSKASYWYKKLADKDSTEALYLYGKLMYDGYTGVTSQSVPWLAKAAEKGHQRAMDILFELYYRGKGDVKKDKKQAQYWAAKSMKINVQNDPKAGVLRALL